MITNRQKFRANFLEECARMGYSIEQVEKVAHSAEVALTAAMATSDKQHPRLKKAVDVSRIVTAPLDLAGRLGPFLGTLALAGVIGAPLVVGTGVGGALAHAVDDDTNLDEAKADEILSELDSEKQKILSMQNYSGG